MREREGDINKCSDRSMEVKLSALLGNYDRKYDRQTNRPTDLLTDRTVAIQKGNVEGLKRPFPLL